ncbi:MAG: cytochrome c oxidase accessory protein CcoG, partial [Oceanospirillales bacterium]|nr:cytochrome c oxidase accessory protein CcoG [Oceanospirillales bacterium]
AFAYTLYSRVPLEVDIIRDRGQLYTTTPDGMIENVYTLKLANKEQQGHEYRITLSGPDGLTLETANVVSIAAGELLDYPVRAQMDPADIELPNYDIQFTVEALDNPSITVTEDNRFIGPTPTR